MSRPLGALLGAAAAALLSTASVQAASLVIFGPSTWDALAPGASEEVNADVLAKLKAGFIAQHPDVTDVTVNSGGTITDGLSRLRNAVLAATRSTSSCVPRTPSTPLMRG